jgi:cyclopropane fatty-acyl-phospholipid synthase-like methyltransferase
VHGYDAPETTRLEDQARTLESLLHHDTAYPPGSLVLEAGCGVGSQTVPLARSSPGARIVAVDVAEASLRAARARIAAEGLADVEFRRADLLDPALRARAPSTTSSCASCWSTCPIPWACSGPCGAC